MPVDSGGNASRPPSPIPVQGQSADAPQVNVPIDDIYSILNLFPFLDGRKPMRGIIDMAVNRIINVATPTGPNDAATKIYVDEALAGAGVEALEVEFDPTEDIASTNVQDAIEEVRESVAPRDAVSIWYFSLKGVTTNGSIYLIDGAFPGTIVRTTVRATSGTGVGTFRVNGSAIGGATHAISSAETTISRTTSNTFGIGDDISFQITGASSLIDVRGAIHFIRTGY